MWGEKKMIKPKIRYFIIFILFFLFLSITPAFAVQLNLTYDGNGNLITGDGKFREYDEFNHLIRVRDGNNITGYPLEEYIWDPTQDRILVKQVNSVTLTDGFDEYIVYVNDNFVRRYDLRGIHEINDTYYIKDDNGLVAEIVFNGTDNSPNFNQGRTLYYHNDHLGSTGVVTNETGSIVEETFYDPYGGIISGGSVSRFDYEGKEFSSFTEDYDFHFRKYNPELGIFTQPDSLLNYPYDPQGLNRYSFERRNPYSYTDPDGHWGVFVVLAAILLPAAVSYIINAFNTLNNGGGFFESSQAGAQAAGQSVGEINTPGGFAGTVGGIFLAGLGGNGLGKTSSFAKGGISSASGYKNIFNPSEEGATTFRSLFGEGGNVVSSIPKISTKNLPSEIQETINLINQGRTSSLGPKIYENRIIPETGKRLLPGKNDPSYYTRYYINGVGKSSDLRVIVGKGGETYFSTGHYAGDIMEVVL